MRTGLSVSQRDQQQVNVEFDRMTSKPMTMEGTASKVLGMFLAVLVGAGATWYLELYSLFFPAMIRRLRSWSLGKFQQEGPPRPIHGLRVGPGCVHRCH